MMPRRTAGSGIAKPWNVRVATNVEGGSCGPPATKKDGQPEMAVPLECLHLTLKRFLFRWHAGKSHAGAVDFVTDIQADQQSRDRLDDARVLQLSAVQRAHSGDPPTVAANGTVVSITTVPGFHTPFSCFSRAAWPEKGTVSTAISHCAAATALSAPSICAAPPMRARSCCAASSARDASRDPMMTCSPARARRFASPEPSGPVPPKIAIFRAIVALLFRSPRRADYTRRQGATLRLVYAIFKNSLMAPTTPTTSEFKVALGQF